MDWFNIHICLENESRENFNVFFKVEKLPSRWTLFWKHIICKLPIKLGVEVMGMTPETESAFKLYVYLGKQGVHNVNS